jgi:hypothetical protein
LLVGSVRLGLIANSRRNAGAYEDGHQEREDADSDLDAAVWGCSD